MTVQDHHHYYPLINTGCIDQNNSFDQAYSIEISCWFSGSKISTLQSFMRC